MHKTKEHSMSDEKLKKTSLNEEHHNLGARMVPFVGWEMPVQYTGVIDEHLTVREHVGIFDVSHMGEIEVKGHDALAYLQMTTTNDVSKLETGQIQYTALTYPEGTFVDDLLVYKLSDNHYLLVVNASNTDKDFEWALENRSDYDVDIKNLSDEYSQIALQGPNTEKVMQSLTDITGLKRGK
jgi:aminomethyltransferase